MDIRFTGPESKKLRVEEEEELMTYLSKAVEVVKNLKQESMEQAAREYKEAAGDEERTSCLHSIRLKFEDILSDHSTILAPHTAKIYAKIMERNIIIEHVRVEKSIIIRCRCKTTDGLLDLDKLVASGELDELFGLAKSCLVNKRVIASVSVSREAFKNCLKSLTADAG